MDYRADDFRQWWLHPRYQFAKFLAPAVGTYDDESTMRAQSIYNLTLVRSE